MGKKYKNLYDTVISKENLRAAFISATKSSIKYKEEYIVFEEFFEINIEELHYELKTKTYKPGKYRKFLVKEPKNRYIQALPFRDRIVQHAIYSKINPIFDVTFYSNSYACRVNKGTHKAVRHLQSDIRKLSNKDKEVYYLKMDFKKYFKNIDHSVLFKEIKNKIKDKDLISLLELFLEESSSKGIPIGNLLSQLFANIYGHIFDRYIKTVLKEKYYYRYMDDTVVLSTNKQHLRIIKDKLETFMNSSMKLEFSHFYIQKINKPLNFLGYRTTREYKLIRKESYLRAKQKIKRYIREGNSKALDDFLGSWKGHIESSDSYNMKLSLIEVALDTLDTLNTPDTLVL